MIMDFFREREKENPTKSMLLSLANANLTMTGCCVKGVVMIIILAEAALMTLTWTVVLDNQ